MRTILLTFSLLFVLKSTFSQSTFSPGYVVKMNGDTLHGFLQEEYRKNITSSIKFRENKENSAIDTFTTTTAKEFKYESGDLYKSVSFKNTLDTVSPDQTRFALQLVEGVYNLFSFIIDDQTYFILTGNGVSYFLYNTVTTGTGEVKIEGNYASRLQVIGVSCAKSALLARDIGYTEKEISEFVNKLNNCISPGNNSVNYYKKPKTIIKFEVYAGGIALGKNKNQVTADAAVRMVYPQLSKNVSINIGAHYSHTTTDQTEKAFGTTVELSSTTDDIICVPVTIQYNIGNWFIKPFVYAGFAGAYLNEKVVYTAYGTPGGPPPSKFGISIIAAAGVEGHITRKLFIKAEWRYELLIQYPSIGLAYDF